MTSRSVSPANLAVCCFLKRALLTIFVAFLMSAIGWSNDSPRATVVRVGVAEYQAPEETYAKFLKFFREISKVAPHEKPVTFQVAVGNYSEVLDWMDKKEIDVAVMAATPTAEMLSLIEIRIKNSKDRPEDLARAKALKDRILGAYVGTIGAIDPNTPAVGSLANFGPNDPMASQVKIDGARFRYRTVAVIAQGDLTKNIVTFQDLLDARPRLPPLKFIFVRPYSASGYIMPHAFLRDLNIDPNAEPFSLDFTGQHSFSLDRLLNPSPEDTGKLLVAFVDDIASPTKSDDLAKLKVLTNTSAFSDPGYLIPLGILMVNYNLGDDYDSFRSLMTVLRERSKNRTSEVALKREDGWEKNFLPLEKNMEKDDPNIPAELPYQVTLDQIIDGIAQYRVTSQKPARVALVLSGGGAKCAYQVG